jgi:hypothetical protein
MNISDAVLDRLLEAIEQTELSSLRWGYVDGSLSSNDLGSLARTVLDREPNISVEDIEDIIEELLDRGLLREVRQADESHRYRSRFAESVRLLRDLKLLTPKRLWSSAPNLVSDFRVDARPRRVPRRDVPAANAIELLGVSLPTAVIRRELASALLGLSEHGNDMLHLAAFQVRAAREILASHQSSRGVVISAGTGSGKTLAFYLPALIEIGSWIKKDEHWTKALALYPRVELLKDQFNEAYYLARRLDATLKRLSRRPITIGTFFSLTPRTATAEAVKQANWPAVRNVAFTCPYLVCPVCGGELVWLQSDLAEKVERLVCKRAPDCSGVVTSDQVVLTRERAVKQPPDILFTTAEMLNQRLNDTGRRIAFGIHPQVDRRVRLVLLDEIHTYTGTTGAQTALVLRRWRHAVGRPLRIVGLSATLREARDFFAQLTGLPASWITEITPTKEEMESLSAEYQLILRGDPVSQTSLLSTSIQTAYLLTRLLDAPAGHGVDHGEISGGRFGSRSFVFTDDLDVVNRFFDDLRDAEGYDLFGNPQPYRAPLSALRSSKQPEPARRDAVGQLWRFCEDIGRDPANRLRVTRTTSQDAGVSTSSDVVVATSALEVGFNDATVGAVLQHKAPLEMASFLQRKGRAGRTMQMRPWMVTVLSDYGRDRIAYQFYDQLFDPVLPPQHLPVRNEYVLRMQAVFAFIDWLADNNENANRRDWWWRSLNGPAEKDDAWRKEQQRAALKTIRALLRGEARPLASLTSHLIKALQLSQEDVRRLLWEPPRSLLLEALPTLDRRLAWDWEIPAISGRASSIDLIAAPPTVQPLPDFIPANLFSDLSLPEVSIILPPAKKDAEERRELMPIVQALRQLAPGRVTRRFAFERGGLSHWVSVPFESDFYELRISDFAAQHEFVASVAANINGEVRELPCFRPWVVHVKIVPKDVSTTSNAFLEWSSQLIPISEGLPLSAHRVYGWEESIVQFEFYLHRFRSPITVRRFAPEATATIRIQGAPDEQIVHTRFTTDAGEPAAIGFEQEVDGLRMRVQLPSAETLAERAAASPEAPAWRSAYFRDRVLEDEELSALTNRFQRDWLYQIYLSALVAQAMRDDSTLEQARDTLSAGDSLKAFRTVMDGIFQMLSEAEDELEEGVAQKTSEGRLQQRLVDLLEMHVIRQRLETLASELWTPEPGRWGAWLRCRLHETIGEALLLACSYMAPRNTGTDMLILDLDRGPQMMADPELAGDVEVWITESTLGGGGVVEAIAEAVSGEPIILTRALAAALAPGESELTSNNLDRFMRLALHDETVAKAIADVRMLSDHALRDKARDALYTTLARRGLGVDHAFSVALNHRLLRTGSDNVSDQLIADMLEAWKKAEERFGVALDLRVFCYLAACDPAFEPRLRAFILATTGANPTTTDMVGVISSVLWPRAGEVRKHALAGFSPFREHGFTDPALVRELILTDRISEVRLDEPDWLTRLQVELASHGRVRLSARREAHTEDELRKRLALILAMPINVDYLQFFPSIEDVRRDEAMTAVTLILRELA